jgi:hypothetical protein
MTILATSGSWLPTNIEGIGINAEQVAEDEMEAENDYDRVYGFERNGYWFRDAHGYSFGHVVSFGTQNKSLTIYCNENGCKTN